MTAPRARKIKKNIMTPSAKVFLLKGVDLGDFASEVQAREAWRAHRTALLTEFIAEHPGERPHAWWEYERPRGLLRRQIYGPLPLVDAPIHRGYPSWWPNKSLLFETEVEFLFRKSLLTRQERNNSAALKAQQREALKHHSVNCAGYTAEEIEQIFADWDAREGDGPIK